jgi:hypothetical protein
MAHSSKTISKTRAMGRHWRSFVDRTDEHRSALHAHCMRLTGSVWDAEDLAQDTLLRLFGALARTEDDVPDPRTYLLRPATHLWIDRLRREARIAPGARGLGPAGVLDGRIARVQIYCFCPEMLAVVARGLGYQALPRPHRSPGWVDVIKALLGVRPRWRARGTRGDDLSGGSGSDSLVRRGTS